MFDIALTDSGDIKLQSSKVISRVKVSFDVAKYSSQKISFLTLSHNKPKPKTGQNISFKYIENDMYEFQNKSYTDIKEAIQYIRLMLKTELYDTDIEDLGSELYKIKHRTISSSTLAKIEDIILDVINGVLDKPSVIAEHKETDGNFYCQSVIATIYSDNEYVTSFELL